MISFFSVFGAVGFVDINKCFREVYRILKPGGIFAFSWFSPIFNCFPRSGENQLEIIRSYFDKSPLIEKKLTKKGILVTYVEFHYTYEDWFRALTENGFIVDLILEPPVKENDDWESKTWEMFPKYKVSKIPSTTIWRAFKSPIKIQNLRKLIFSKSDELLKMLTEKGGVSNEKN
ncbi:MAG: hypothetical protein DRP08_05720 [Candidatus Aenigmatarchaeota archaeon]|nr:MAG: hypothetical protein DRP08_05720 [Candidatus Aenigmarchaeota archaeon]